MAWRGGTEALSDLCRCVDVKKRVAGIDEFEDILIYSGVGQFMQIVSQQTFLF